MSPYNPDSEYDWPYYVVLTRTDDWDYKDPKTVWKTVIACNDTKETQTIQDEAKCRGMYRSIHITDHKPNFNFKYDYTVSFAQFDQIMHSWSRAETASRLREAAEKELENRNKDKWLLRKKKLLLLKS
jgi:hypothetical protein